MEHMVDAFETAGLLNSDQTIRLFHNADDGVIARRRRTNATRLYVREVVTDCAKSNSFLYFVYGRNQSLELILGRAHDVERKSLRRLVSNAGQAFQFVDESGDRLGVFKHR